jgi:hypothetical protein
MRRPIFIPLENAAPEMIFFIQPIQAYVDDFELKPCKCKCFDAILLRIEKAK